MKSMNLSDAQLDEAARRYSTENGVSYVQALSTVASMAQFSEGAPGAPLPVAATGGEPSDSQVHFEAMAYHLAHKVDYAQALIAVIEAYKAKRAQGAAVVQKNFSPDADQQLHRSAVSYAESNRVSYAEALDAVAGGDLPVSAKDALQGKAIEIFRAGSHVDTAGNSRSYSVDDVKAMASVYDPAIHEAPLTIGHPADDLPAQGWVSGLSATDDGVLLMRTRMVDPVFAADVKAGRFLKRSAAFYPPTAPTNPVPGFWYLRHVAWLGAMPPAVKRLADVNFSAADDAVVFKF